jgi:hypothetical protein
VVEDKDVKVKDTEEGLPNIGEGVVNNELAAFFYEAHDNFYYAMGGFFWTDSSA